MWQKILPPGILVQDGPPPPAPDNYEEGYVLPVHTVKPLQVLNSHEKDAHLKFYEKRHIYTWKGVPTTASVTYLAHQFESPFDPDSAISMMKWSKSQAWPRVEYVVDAKEFRSEDFTPSRGGLLVYEGKTVAVCHPYSVDSKCDIREYLNVATVKGVTIDAESDCEYYTYERGMSDTEIKEQWSKKGKIACNMGTEAHYQAELYFNGLPPRECPELNVVKDFAIRYMIPNGLVSWNTEKEVVCEDADVAGSVDLILYDTKKDLYHIVDHKRSDKLKKDLRGYRKMKPPFNHLDDCKGAAYALQLSIYQWIMEKEYGMKFGERVLLSLHPDNPFCTSVPYLREEVEYIMGMRMNLVAARRKVASEEARFRCAWSGAAIVDAVTTKDGTKVMEKMAQLKEVQYTADVGLRREFEKRVQEVKCNDPILGKCEKWVKQMPVEGIVSFNNFF